MSARVVLAIARVEIRRSWLSLVAIGLLAGIAAGVALGTFSLSRRTTSAPVRLANATQLDDARVSLFGGSHAAQRIKELPVVRSSWTAENAVGQVVGAGRQFVSISFGPERPADLFTPVVVHGRAPAEDRTDEVLISEALHNASGLGPGDVLRLDMLLPEEVFQFDTGFGEPDGPDLALTVTGVARMTSRGGDGFGPVWATPAFAAKYGDLSAGPTMLLRLEPGPGSRAALDAALVQIGKDDPSVASSEFGPLHATYPAALLSPQVGAARGVLGGGLMLFSVIAAVAGLLVTAQALARHAAGMAGDQRIESALGIVRAERVAGRLLPALLTIVVASTLAVPGVLVAGGVQPLGALRAYEPHVGWLPDVPVAVLGSLATAAVIAALVVVTTLVAERRARPRTGGSVVTLRPTRLRRPSIVLGTALAFGGRRNGARGSVLTAVIAVAGIVATATFAASLHRLEHTPERYGWTSDFAIADVRQTEIDRLTADDRLTGVRVGEQATIRVSDSLVDAYAFTDHKGVTPTTVVDGRLPRTATETALGENVARRLGAHLGDEIPLGADGDRATVVGVVVVAPTSDERLGDVVVLDPDGMRAFAETAPWTTAYLTVRDGLDARAVQASYNDELETITPEPPGEVRNLLDLGALPIVLEMFLAALAAAALAHAVVQALRRRRRDLAVVRTLGLTPRQVGGALLVMGAAIACGGLLFGVPLGIVLGRLTWAETAIATGVAPDAAPPVLVLTVLVPVSIALACVVALLPAWRAARLSPAPALRDE